MIMAIAVRTRRSSKSSSEAKFLGHKRGRKQHNRWAPCGQWCPLAKRRLTWWMDSLWKITSNHANLKSQPLFYSCQFETPFQVLMVGWRTSRKEAAPPPRPYQKWKMGHERQPCTVGFLIRKKSRELNYKIFRFCWPFLAAATAVDFDLFGFCAGAFLQWLQCFLRRSLIWSKVAF